MCQLLALNCKTPTDATFSFTGFCQRGGMTDEHADGGVLRFSRARGCAILWTIKVRLCHLLPS